MSLGMTVETQAGIWSPRHLVLLSEGEIRSGRCRLQTTIADQRKVPDLIWLLHRQSLEEAIECQ